jgi:3-methylcrotonyl-CoA carboxylase alpha subunit
MRLVENPTDFTAALESAQREARSSFRVTKGTAVAKGDSLLVLEAMKMEHVLTAPRDGVVAEVLVAERDQVKDGTLLLRLEASDG